MYLVNTSKGLLTEAQGPAQQNRSRLTQMRQSRRKDLTLEVKKKISSLLSIYLLSKSIAITPQTVSNAGTLFVMRRPICCASRSNSHFPLVLASKISLPCFDVNVSF